MCQGQVGGFSYQPASHSESSSDRPAATVVTFSKAPLLQSVAILSQGHDHTIRAEVAHPKIFESIGKISEEYSKSIGAISENVQTASDTHSKIILKACGNYSKSVRMGSERYSP